MDYKMKDILRITGLPRTTIQKYFPQKNRKDIFDKTAWTFSEDELADLWLIRICFALGKRKDEILRFLEMNDQEKRKRFKDMIDKLQNYINEASMYIEFGVLPFQLDPNRELDSESYSFLSNLMKTVTDTFTEDDLFENELDDREYDKIHDLLVEISDFENKNTQDKIKELDDIIGKISEEVAIKKTIIMESIDEEFTEEKRQCINELVENYYKGSSSIQDQLSELYDEIFDDCTKFTYFSSHVQDKIQLLYNLYKRFGWKGKYVDLYIKKIKDFLGSKENIEKYESGVEKGFMWYISKAFETYIKNNIKEEEK